jgi:regulatory protein
LAEINPDDYYATLKKHTEKKLPSLIGQTNYIIRGKLSQHLFMKGFEGDLIREVIEEVLSNR